MSGGDETYADALRQQAALARYLGEQHAETADELERLSLLGPVSPEFVAMNRRGAAFIQQLGAVQAAQALAYDAMIAAGGPENSRAYVEYEAATKRNTALLPQEPLD